MSNRSRFKKFFLYSQYILIISILLSGGILLAQVVNGMANGDADPSDGQDGTTPLDSDSDGWSDEDEALAGTDPYNPDTDGDGLKDPDDPNALIPQSTEPPTTQPPTTQPPTTQPPTTQPPTTQPPTTQPPTTQPPTTQPPTTSPPNERVLEVYHFHGIHQCTSCILADEYAYYTIFVYFNEEYEQGIITYGSYNYEDDECYDLVNWLNVYGSSIYVIERLSSGETEVYNPTNKLWTLVGNKEQFVNYFKGYLEEKLCQ